MIYFFPIEYSTRKRTFGFWMAVRNGHGVWRHALCALLFYGHGHVFNENVFSLLWCFTPYVLQFTLHGINGMDFLFSGMVLDI
jgi:hypothetical protein